MQGCVDVAVHFIAVSPSRDAAGHGSTGRCAHLVALESGVRRFGASSTVFEIATPQFNGLPGFQLLARCQELAQSGRRKFRFNKKLLSLDAIVIDVCASPSSCSGCWIMTAPCPVLP